MKGSRAAGYIWFDQDDTLYDYHEAMARALNACLAMIHDSYPQTRCHLGTAELVDVRAEISRRDDYGEMNLVQARELAFCETLDRYASANPALAQRLGETYFEALSADIRPYAGVADCLKKLSDDGYVLGIVSNGLCYLEQLGLASLFAHTVYANDLRIYKPHRAIFEHAMSLAGAIAEECVLIGDSGQCDVVGARQAGWTGVWLNRDAREWELDCEPPEHVVSCLSELPALVAGLHGGMDGSGEQDR